MKRSIITILALLLLCALVLPLAACGNNDDMSTTTAQAPVDPEPDPEYTPVDFSKVDITLYVAVGKYRGHTVEVSSEVTDEAVDKMIEELRKEYGEPEKILTGTTKAGDRANVSYVGYIDDIAFDGGTGSATIVLDDAKSGMIPGFASGLVGKAIGSTVTLNLHFPEDYHSEEYAGKDARFEITINYVEGETRLPDLTDAWVAEISGGKLTTVAQLRDYIREELESERQYECYDLLMKTIAGASLFTNLAENTIDEEYLYVRGEIEAMALSYGLDYETALAYGIAAQMLGMEIYTDEELRTAVDEGIRESILLYAVIRAEKMAVTDEEYAVYLQELAEAYGTTPEEFEATYGADYIREVKLKNKVFDFLLAENTFVPRAEN